MIYKKKLFFIKKQRIATIDDSFSFRFFTYLTNYFGKIFIFYKKVVSLHSKI